jgi:hypothetical protein
VNPAGLVSGLCQAGLGKPKLLLFTIWNLRLATPYIKGFFYIEVFYIECCYDIECSNFYINITSFDIEVAKKTFDLEETSTPTSRTSISCSNVKAL